jgi:hypothetical protein
MNLEPEDVGEHTAIFRGPEFRLSADVCTRRHPILKRAAGFLLRTTAPRTCVVLQLVLFLLLSLQIGCKSDPSFALPFFFALVRATPPASCVSLFTPLNTNGQLNKPR